MALLKKVERPKAMDGGDAGGRAMDGGGVEGRAMDSIYIYIYFLFFTHRSWCYAKKVFLKKSTLPREKTKKVWRSHCTKGTMVLEYVFQTGIGSGCGLRWSMASVQRVA